MMARIRYFTKFKGEHVETGAPCPWTDYEKVKDWHLMKDERVGTMGSSMMRSAVVATVTHYLELAQCS